MKSGNVHKPASICKIMDVFFVTDDQWTIVRTKSLKLLSLHSQWRETNLENVYPSCSPLPSWLEVVNYMHFIKFATFLTYRQTCRSMSKVKATCHKFWHSSLITLDSYLVCFGSISSTRCTQKVWKACPHRILLTCRIWLRRRFWAELCESIHSCFFFFTLAGYSLLLVLILNHTISH